jgi:hypothetical protein
MRLLSAVCSPEPTAPHNALSFTDCTQHTAVDERNTRDRQDQRERHWFDIDATAASHLVRHSYQPRLARAVGDRGLKWNFRKRWL